MNDNTKSYNSIDIMKFLMALVVVSIHTEPLCYTKNLCLLYAVEALRNIAVPFFFIATGFLIVKKEESGVENAIQRHMIKTLKLYLIMSLVYLPLAIVYYVIEKRGVLFSIIHYFRGLIVTGEHYNSWMLWYLLATFYCLLGIHVFDKLKVKRRTTIYFLFIVGVVVSVCISILLSFDENAMNGALLNIRNLISSTIADDRLFRAFVYIPMGMLIANVNVKRIAPVSVVALVLGYGCVLVSYVYGIEWRYVLIATKSIWTIIGSFGLFGITCLVSLKDGSIYRYLRSLSSFMYFSHMWIWTIFYVIVYGEKTYGALCYVVTVVVSVLLESVIYYVRKSNSKFKEATSKFLK